MTDDINKKLKKQARLAAIPFVLGGVLMIMMITVEDEPGGVPVLLVLAGLIWYLITRLRMRLHNTL